MDDLNRVFLELLKTSLQAGADVPMRELSAEQWKEIFDLANAHKVLPMIYEAALKTPACKETLGTAASLMKRQVLGQVMAQTIRTDAFLTLYRKLQEAGIRPLVVKGIICRNLYPAADHRPSGDEDVLIKPEEFSVCHRVFTEFGLQAQISEAEFSSAFEISYRKAGSALHIELHKALFPPESDAYGDMNRLFEGVQERAVAENIQGTAVYTMGYTDHLFYLICHALKHFLHSGFGIRQVCDIVMYANAYGSEINWVQLLEKCRQIRGEKFAAAIFQIGRKHLVLDPDKACYPQSWEAMAVDEEPMLEDLLCGGIYGDASMSRKHSSSITLDAVTAQKQGKKRKHGAIVSVFPPASKLKDRYPYLTEYPWLLPVAWSHRLLVYFRETRHSQNNNATESLKIGRDRVLLLKEYGILE